MSVYLKYKASKDDNDNRRPQSLEAPHTDDDAVIFTGTEIQPRERRQSSGATSPARAPSDLKSDGSQVSKKAANLPPIPKRALDRAKQTTVNFFNTHVDAPRNEPSASARTKVAKDDFSREKVSQARAIDSKHTHVASGTRKDDKSSPVINLEDASPQHSPRASEEQPQPAQHAGQGARSGTSSGPSIGPAERAQAQRPPANQEMPVAPRATAQVCRLSSPPAALPVRGASCAK